MEMETEWNGVVNGNRTGTRSGYRNGHLCYKLKDHMNNTVASLLYNGITHFDLFHTMYFY